MIPRLAILTVGTSTLVYWNGKALRGDVTDLSLHVNCTEGGLKRTLNLEVNGEPAFLDENTDLYKTIELLKDGDFLSGDLEVTVNGKAEPMFTDPAHADD